MSRVLLCCWASLALQLIACGAEPRQVGLHREDAPGSPSLYVVSIDGTGLTRLAGYYGVLAPQWSPDGRRLAYSTDGEAYVVDADGSSPPLSLGEGFGPSWSTDGSQVAVFQRGGGIWLVTVESGNRTYLATGHSPLWAPSGETIAFADEGDIYLIKNDGTGRRLAARDESGLLGSLRPVRWSPNGEQLVVGASLSYVGDVSRTLHHLVLDEGELLPGAGMLSLTWQSEVEATSEMAGLCHPETWPSDAIYGVISPDGPKLACPVTVTRVPVGQTEVPADGLYILETGSSPGPPLVEGSWIGLVAWSPTGDRLAMATIRSGTLRSSP